MFRLRPKDCLYDVSRQNNGCHGHQTSRSCYFVCLVYFVDRVWINTEKYDPRITRSTRTVESDHTFN